MATYFALKKDQHWVAGLDGNVMTFDDLWSPEGSAVAYVKGMLAGDNWSPPVEIWEVEPLDDDSGGVRQVGVRVVIETMEGHHVVKEP